MPIKRNIETAILRHLKAKEITIIIGARQVGKTTLLKSIKRDLDIQSHQQYFQSQQAFLQKLKLVYSCRKTSTSIGKQCT